MILLSLILLKLFDSNEQGTRVKAEEVKKVKIGL
jgi:hypothetical protein